MTNGTDQAALAELESAINFFFEQFEKKPMNHFELLGTPTTGTQKEIVAAYKKYSEEFSPQRIALIPNAEARRRGNFMMEQGKKAYDTLSDYKMRAQYEEWGYRDTDPELEQEEGDKDKAKDIYRKAKSLKTMKEFRKAAIVMEEAVKLDQSSASYYLLLGLCQTQVPDLKRKAETNLLKASEMEPWNAEPFAAMGMLFYSERLLKRAETYFRKALELEPSHALAKSKLEEISGPVIKPFDAVQKKLGKLLPSIFGKKK